MFGNIKHNNPPPEKIKEYAIIFSLSFCTKILEKDYALRRNVGFQNEVPVLAGLETS